MVVQIWSEGRGIREISRIWGSEKLRARWCHLLSWGRLREEQVWRGGNRDQKFCLSFVKFETSFRYPKWRCQMSRHALEHGAQRCDLGWRYQCGRYQHLERNLSQGLDGRKEGESESDDKGPKKGPGLNPKTPEFKSRRSHQRQFNFSTAVQDSQCFSSETCISSLLKRVNWQAGGYLFLEFIIYLFGCARA